MKAKGLLLLGWASGLIMVASFIGFLSELFASDEMAGYAPFMLIAATISAGLFLMAIAWRKG